MLTHIKQIAPYVEKSKPLLILSKKRVIISKNIQSTKMWLTYHRRERGKCLQTAGMTEKMLSKILSKEECAKCRICCCFDSYDIWETPYISQTLASKILQEYTPKQEFIKKENHFLFKMDKEQNADLYYCPMLDNELADQIFEYADENPEAVKPYLDGYPILVVEGKKYKDTLV